MKMVYFQPLSALIIDCSHHSNIIGAGDPYFYAEKLKRFLSIKSNMPPHAMY